MRILTVCLITAMFFSACNQEQGFKEKMNEQNSAGVASPAKKNIVRYGSVTGLKPEKVAYYKELHAAAWPAVLKKIAECNIQNYSIYLKEIDGKPMLFSYFEYAGNNFDADMKKMAADTTTQRWWRETDPCQLPLPEAMEKHQIWTSMQEVFHTN